MELQLIGDKTVKMKFVSARKNVTGLKMKHELKGGLQTSMFICAIHLIIFTKHLERKHFPVAK